MARALILVTVLGLALSGCGFGKSRFNPFNWFGPPRVGTPVAIYSAPVDPRGLVQQVLTLKVEPYPGGAIVRATGLPPTQGFWDASLVLLPDDGKGHLIYEFRIAAPKVPAPAGSQPSREVVVAVNATDFQLQDVNSIEVKGASNGLSAHR